MIPKPAFAPMPPDWQHVNQWLRALPAHTAAAVPTSDEVHEILCLRARMDALSAAGRRVPQSFRQNQVLVAQHALYLVTLTLEARVPGLAGPAAPPAAPQLPLSANAGPVETQAHAAGAPAWGLTIARGLDGLMVKMDLMNLELGNLRRQLSRFEKVFYTRFNGNQISQGLDSLIAVRSVSGKIKPPKLPAEDEDGPTRACALTSLRKIRTPPRNDARAWCRQYGLECHKTKVSKMRTQLEAYLTGKDLDEDSDDEKASSGRSFTLSAPPREVREDSAEEEN
ncbi:hypothetical protein JCM11251_006196 [Rhodosporidiobolus azoricus]